MTAGKEGAVGALAAWANDTSVPLDEANRRAGVYADVTDLIEAAKQGCALIKAQGELIERYRTSGQCPKDVAEEAVALLHKRNALVTTRAVKAYNPARLDAALARFGGAK